MKCHDKIVPRVAKRYAKNKKKRGTYYVTKLHT